MNRIPEPHNKEIKICLCLVLPLTEITYTTHYSTSEERARIDKKSCPAIKGEVLCKIQVYSCLSALLLCFVLYGGTGGTRTLFVLLASTNLVSGRSYPDPEISTQSHSVSSGVWCIMFTKFLVFFSQAM